MAQTEPPADIQPPAAAGQIDDSAAGAVADGDTTPADAPDDARSDEAGADEAVREVVFRGAPRGRDIVAIGDNAVVRAGQSAESLVVIRGDAVIDGEVDGDVVVLFGKLHLTGSILGDVVVVLGDANIEGTIGGELTLIVSPATIGADARLENAIVAVGEVPIVDPAASLEEHPQIFSLGPFSAYLEASREYLFQGVFLLRPFPPRIGWVWWFAAGFLLFHVLVVMVFPGATRTCMETLQAQPARSFLVGLVTCVLVGPVSLLLSFTMFAPPLIWLAFFALCVFGRITVYAAAGAGFGRGVGARLLQNPLPAMVIGSVFFYVVYMVPILGFAVYWLVLPWGVGATLICMVEALRRERRPPYAVTPGAPAGPQPVRPSYGSLSAAAGLTSGVSGPATHGLVGDTGLPGAEASTASPDSVAGTPPPIPPSPAGHVPPSDPPRIPNPPGPIPLAPFSPMALSAAPRVGFWARLGAALIDLIVVGFVNQLVFGSFEAFWILLGAYHFGMWTWRATTLGGAVLGVRLIRLDGREVDWQTSLVRTLGSLVSLLPLGLGFFWVAWDDQVQSWHDRIAGTTIVRADRRMALV